MWHYCTELYKIWLLNIDKISEDRKPDIKRKIYPGTFILQSKGLFIKCGIGIIQIQNRMPIVVSFFPRKIPQVNTSGMCSKVVLKTCKLLENDVSLFNSNRYAMVIVWGSARDSQKHQQNSAQHYFLPHKQ